MFLLNDQKLYNLALESNLSVEGNVITRGSNSNVLYRGSDKEDAVNRFNDIVGALGADVKVYDCSNDIGSWNKKKAAGRPKAEPK